MLELGETWVYTCSQQINETTVNTATATGEASDEDGNVYDGIAPVQDTDQVTVTVIAPGIEVVKSVDYPIIYAGEYAGELVTYTYLVTNLSQTTLSDVVILDDKCGTPDGPLDGDLAPANGLLDIGETWRYTCTMALLTDTTNVVTVTALPSTPAGDRYPGVGRVNDDDTVDVNVINPSYLGRQDCGAGDHPSG